MEKIQGFVKHQIFQREKNYEKKKRRKTKRRKSFRNHSLKYHYFCFRCIPCCLIPLLMPRFLRFHHFCSDPECNGRIGTFSGKYLKTWYFSQGTSWVATLCWKPLWTCLNLKKTDFNVLRGHSAAPTHIPKWSMSVGYLSYGSDFDPLNNPCFHIC